MQDSNHEILEINKNICQQLKDPNCKTPSRYFERVEDALVSNHEKIPRVISLTKREIKEIFCELDITHLQLDKTRINTFPACKKNSRLTKTLKWVHLPGNYLTDLPKAFANFEQIDHLNLNNNKFTEIPEEIFTLENLKTLYFSRNKIETIQDSIKNLTHLTTLNMDENHLEKLPDIDLLPKLKYLNVNENKIKTFPKISRSSNLRSLSLDSNRLEEIPSRIKNFTELRELSLSNNRINSFANDAFDHPFPDVVYPIEFLNLSGNKLKTLPDSFGNLIRLKYLNINFNPISDFSEEILKLYALEKIEVLMVPFSNEQINHINRALRKKPNLKIIS